MFIGVIRRLWSALKWLWSILILAFLIGYAANVAQTSSTDFIKNFPTSTIGWLFFGSDAEYTYAFIVFLLLSTILTGFLIALEEYQGGGRELNKYLRDVVDEHHDLRPAGFAQQSALISVSVPLKDIFIRLHAISDRPRFDLPAEQIRQLEELRHRSDVSIEQREEQIQALRVIWYSQLGQEWSEAREPQQVSVEDVLSQLTSEQPAAVILGPPGAGKSTTMRWFAFQMARAWRLSIYRHSLNKLFTWLSKQTHTALPWSYHLPEGLAPAQIPILLAISEYAESLNTVPSKQLPFQQFLIDTLHARYAHLPNIAEKLTHQLQQGNCLLLLDGLDEVANDELRRRVSEQIAKFVASHTPKNGTARRYNRFIVTSRIISYQAGAFVKYAHYTLQGLKDEQIQHFLTTWCPGVEYHQRTFAQGMRKLNAQQRSLAERDGLQQRDRLLEVFKNSPSIKRLAVNPLMLTILALIQRSGKTLPHRRVELYQIVVRTLLDNWNHDKGRRVFPVEEIPLAEDLLMHFAYVLHNGNPLLTEAQVKQITGPIMQNFYKHSPSEKMITQFIDTLRRSSGLFVESGQGLFSFMHRTFQEYFVALYLHLLPEKELLQFVREHCQDTTWLEPLQLLMAYKSGQNTEERLQASSLIEAIIQTKSPLESLLHRNLFFAAHCLIDCNVWAIRSETQQTIANHLFELYGDALGTGRYTGIQQEVERLMQLWLLGQPQGSTQKETFPPLLKAWHTALCTPEFPVRQEGAVHILASIASTLGKCPPLVLAILIPPLIHLASVQDCPYPPEIRQQLTQCVTQPASKKVEEYAFTALRLFDKDGPAGWLYQQWEQWHTENPWYLQRLTEHSHELGHFLTPVAFPTHADDSNWSQQLEAGQRWRLQRDFGSLQMQLFHAAQTARFPYAYLLKQMLDAEQIVLSLKKTNQSWKTLWDSFLKGEMERGHGATYQMCLSLRLLLCHNDPQQFQRIAVELKNALLTPGKQQVCALLVICNVYLRYIEYVQDVKHVRLFKDIQYLRDLLDFRYIRHLRDLPDIIDLLMLLDLLELPYIIELQNRLHLLHLLDFLYLLDLRHLRDIETLRDIRYLRDSLPLRSLADYITQEDLITIFCDLLKNMPTLSSLLLIGIYSVISTYETVPQDVAQKVEESIVACEQMFASLSQETKILIVALRSLNTQALLLDAGRAGDTLETPDETAIKLTTWANTSNLPQAHITELLAACIDRRTLSEKVWEEIAGKKTFQVGTVGEIAWKLLQEVRVSSEAMQAVLQCLEAKDAVICASAALLLQRQADLPLVIQQKAAEIIVKILADPQGSRRPLNPPQYDRIWKLDDVLFDTLSFIAALGDGNVRSQKNR